MSRRRRARPQAGKAVPVEVFPEPFASDLHDHVPVEVFPERRACPQAAKDVA
jgi:hypothetical protein